MNKDLIKLHNELLAGEADIKDVSDKDLASFRNRFIMIDMMSYPNFDVYVMAVEEIRRREIDAAKKKIGLDEAMAILKKKTRKIDRNFF